MRHSLAKRQEKRCPRFLRWNHRRSPVTSRTLPLSFSRLSAKRCAKIARNGIRAPMNCLRRSEIFVTNCEFKAELKRSTAARKLAAFIVLAAIVAGAFFAFRMSRHRAVPVPPFPEKSIAVLPFLDLSQAKDQEYFCDGMSEEILDALAKVDGLRVVARTSSFSFKGKNPDVSDLRKKLNVENVVEGSVRRDGNRVRIGAQLINARNGLQLWSETYERELQGVFALQDEITRAIVDALKIKLAISLPAH